MGISKSLLIKMRHLTHINQVFLRKHFDWVSTFLVLLKLALTSIFANYYLVLRYKHPLIVGNWTRVYAQVWFVFT